MAGVQLVSGHAGPPDLVGACRETVKHLIASGIATRKPLLRSDLAKLEARDNGLGS